MSNERHFPDDHITSLDERIERLQKGMPAGEVRSIDRLELQRELSCPLCGQECERGLVSVHGTFWGTMIIGFSHQQCWFEPFGGGPEIEIIPSGHAKRGWRCKGCDFVGIEGGRRGP